MGWVPVLSILVDVLSMVPILLRLASLFLDVRVLLFCRSFIFDQCLHLAALVVQQIGRIRAWVPSHARRRAPVASDRIWPHTENHT